MRPDEQPVFDQQKVWRDASEVIAALTADLNGIEGVEDFILRDTLAGQRYVCAAQHTLLKTLILSIVDAAPQLSLNLLLEQMALKVAARGAGVQPL